MLRANGSLTKDLANIIKAKISSNDNIRLYKLSFIPEDHYTILSLPSMKYDSLNIYLNSYEKDINCKLSYVTFDYIVNSFHNGFFNYIHHNLLYDTEKSVIVWFNKFIGLHCLYQNTNDLRLHVIGFNKNRSIKVKSHTLNDLLQTKNIYSISPIDIMYNILSKSENSEEIKNHGIHVGAKLNISEYNINITYDR